MEYINFLETSNGPNYIALALVIVVLIIIVLLITLISKIVSKPKDKVEVLDDQKPQNNPKPKKPIKKTGIIDDPAMVRMSIEEAKADLSNFNVKTNDETKKDDEII